MRLGIFLKFIIFSLRITHQFQRALKHVQPSAKREGFATVPDVTWDDIGALHKIREELQMAILVNNIKVSPLFFNFFNFNSYTGTCETQRTVQITWVKQPTRNITGGTSRVWKDPLG